MSEGQEGPLYGRSLNTLGGPPGLRRNKIHSLDSCKVMTQSNNEISGSRMTFTVILFL